MPSSRPLTDRLIVFLKYPEPGRVKTRLAASMGPARAAAVYRFLAESTLRQTSSDVPSCYDTRIFFDPPARELAVRKWLEGTVGAMSLHPQSSGGLGQRMSEAFRQTFSLPATGRVVIVGTDCPSVDQSIIITAFKALENVPVVLGPAIDGGYYLLGLRQEMPWLFDEVSWSTEHVLSQTISALRANRIEYSLLPELPDIDTMEDLERWLSDWEAREGRDGEGADKRLRWSADGAV